MGFLSLDLEYARFNALPADVAHRVDTLTEHASGMVGALTERGFRRAPRGQNEHGHAQLKLA